MRFGELLAGPGGGALAVDAYAVQHPGVEERRAVQSVAVHLLDLCSILERGGDPGEAPDLIRGAIARSPGWTWLPVSQPIGTITVSDVLAGRRDVAQWADDVWDAFAPHHDQVRAWLDLISRPAPDRERAARAASPGRDPRPARASQAPRRGGRHPGRPPGTRGS